MNFAAPRHPSEIRLFRKNEIYGMRGVVAVVSQLAAEEPETRERRLIPLLRKRPDEFGMGCRAWADQPVHGFPTIGVLAEPRVCPAQVAGTQPIFRSGPIRDSRIRPLSEVNKSSSREDPLREEVNAQTTKGPLGFPHVFA